MRIHLLLLLATLSIGFLHAESDQDWVKKTVQGNMLEIDLAKRAANQAKDGRVKNFALMIVQHHGIANKELEALAANKQIELPATLPAEMTATIERIGTLSDDLFDKAYIQAMVADHEKDVADFEGAVKNLGDPQIKAWAAKTLPTLREHLKAAQTLRDALTNPPATK